MAELKPTKGKPASAVEAAPSKPKRELPRVTFTAEDIPEVKDWKIGGKYYLELEVEQVAAEKDRYGLEGEKENPLTATFKVVAVKAVRKTEAKKEDNPGPKKTRRNPNELGY